MFYFRLPPRIQELLGDSGDSSNSDSDAWEGSGMCYAHFMYGAQARSCKPPCSRAGN